MRLIDANALLENQPKDCCRTSDWINTAPTIDAIPVEWLRKKREIAIWQFAGAIDWLLGDWQKEQEAQDG